MTAHSDEVFARSKRAIDVTLSVLALLLLVPVFLVAAVLVRISSPGPVLFRARRVGCNGREFDMLPKRNLWRSGKNAWVVLAARLPGFEEWVFRVSELIRDGDRRIGRVSRRR